MAIKKNPYGVGYSGERAFERPRICSCCGIEYLWRGTDETSMEIAVCPLCEGHGADTPEQELQMLRDHQGHLVDAVNKARHMTRETKRENARLAEIDKSRREQVAAALQARDRFRGVVEALQQTHILDKGGCACGQKDCDVLEVLQKSYRQADSWYY